MSRTARNDEDRLPGRLLKRTFFEATPERVAPRLLGKVLASRTRFGWMAGRIVEVEAYLGPHHETADPAAHAHRGPTTRNRVLFGAAGHAYVYSIYGMHFCMNISCEPTGQAGSVLLRALQPLIGMEQMARNRGVGSFPALSGAKGAPAKDGATTRKGWGNGKENDGARTRRGWSNVLGAGARLLTSGPGRLCQALGITRAKDNGLDLLDDDSPLQVRDDGFRGGRVMVTVRIGIRHAADLPLRFSLAGNPFVSGSRTMAGKIISLRSTSLSTLK